MVGKTVPWIVLITVIVVADLFAIYMNSELAGRVIEKPERPLTVSELLRKAVLNETVLVEGLVSEVLPEYKSKRGFRYQQFYLSDGDGKIKIFCSEKYGKVDVSEGNRVLVEGKYQKYYRELEVYTYCSEIRIL